MENLLIPFLFITPVVLSLNIYRIWQLFNKRARLKHRIVSALHTTLILGTLIGYGTLGFCAYRCVWPGQCGEGFASGYIAAAIMLGIGAVSLVFLVSEMIYAIAKKEASPFTHSS
ncbi:MAG: hypothetical protein AB2689_25830 [Candidatus Thiodiazotropha taylori]